MSWLYARANKGVERLFEKIAERLLTEIIAWLVLFLAAAEYVGVGRLGIG